MERVRLIETEQEGTFCCGQRGFLTIVQSQTPATMADFARSYISAHAIKLKLTDDDLNAARVLAVRAARPDVWLMVNANQGFTRKSYCALVPTLLEARADESVQTQGDLQKLVGRVDIINIKLDRCGGLAERLAL